MSDLDPNQAGSNYEQEQMHKEGTDYIKDQAQQNQYGDDGTGKGTRTTLDPQPPASNPGAGDPSAYIPKGSGGISSAAHVGSPVTNEDKSGGIVDTVKSILGLQSQPSEKRAEDTQARNAEVTAEDIATTAPAVVAAAAVAAFGGSNKTFTAEVADRTRAAENNVTQSKADTAASSAVPASESTNKMENTNTSSLPGRQGDTFDKPVSDGPPTDTISGSGAGDTFDEPVNRNNPDSEDYSNTQSSTNDETSGTTEGGAPPKSSGRMENESAIPTAGGQRLGEEHWGESKVVPENPKPQDTEGGGSFDSETADNTAKNTGGAHGGSEGEGKQSMMDKIKDKLPIGNKNKD